MVPDSWEMTALLDLACYQNGKAFRSDDWRSSGLPLIRIPQMDDPQSVEHFVDSNSVEDRFRLEAGDLLFSWSGTLKVTRWKGPDAALNQHIFNVRPANGIDGSFLEHLISRSIATLEARAHGTTMRHVTKRMMSGFALPIPSLPEQEKIAAVLSSVDDALAATRKVIEQSQRVKKGILQDLMTCGIGHTRFKETEIGEIPEEWEVVRLVEIMEDGVQNGYSPRCPIDSTGRWILSLGALSPDGFQPSEKKPAPEHDDKVSEFFLRPGDFLISRSNTSERVGWSALFRGEIEACAYPDLMMRFRIKQDRVLPEFMESYLYSRPALKHLQARAAGTSGSMVKINQSVLKTLPVAVPPIDEQREIADFLARFRKSHDRNNQKEIVLKRLKGGLMQDLLTGRVRVPVD